MQAQGRIADVLDSLARRDASGILEISGDPGGFIYFDEGYLTFAESAAVPDLGSRLINSGLLTFHQWALAAEESRAGASMGDILVSHGLVTGDGLRSLLESIVLDVLIALAMPTADGSFTSGTWFVPHRPHWAGAVLRIDAVQVWAYAEDEAARLAALNVLPGTCPKLCDLTRPWVVIGRGDWLVASQINGRRTVADLARGNGLALHEAIRRVGRLARAGLCATAPADSGGGRLRPVERPARDITPPDDVPAAEKEGGFVLPSQESLTTGPGQGDGSRIPGLPRRRPGVSGITVAPVDRAVLRQVLERLESLGKRPDERAGRVKQENSPD